MPSVAIPINICPAEDILTSGILSAFSNLMLSLVVPVPPTSMVNLPWLLEEAPPEGWNIMEVEAVAVVERMIN